MMKKADYKRIILFIVLLLFIFPLSEISAQGWYSANWSYRKKITIDNTKVGGSTNHTDFPVLVSTASDGDLIYSEEIMMK
ncbi:MAG: hypothetical protein HN431_10065 [Bacteroidetes bacterium]|jgi:hypothetical protein|nr:hypothetical protein [Bacteroidota bacterium]